MHRVVIYYKLQNPTKNGIFEVNNLDLSNAVQHKKPTIPAHLLWEYNVEQFDYDRSKRIVIERVIERGGIEEWKEMIRYYGVPTILQIARASKQLSLKDKSFTEIFVHSNLVNATPGV